MKAPSNPLLRKLAGYLQEQAYVQREAALRRGGPLYDFGIGDPREPTPSFIRAALREAVPEVSQYPSIGGLPALRKAVSGYLQRRFGLAVDPETEILPCARQTRYRRAWRQQWIQGAGHATAARRCLTSLRRSTPMRCANSA